MNASDGVVALIAAVAGRDPDRIAIASTDDGVPAVSYGELLDQSAGLAAGLADLGIGRGDVVALWLPNMAEYVVLLLAAERLGVCIVGLNTRYRSEELRAILRSSRARAIVLMAEFASFDFSATLREVRADLPELRLALYLGPGGLGFASDDAGLERPVSSKRIERRPHDALAAFTTSGTTAAAKLATHDAESAARHARNDAVAFELRERDVNLCILPFCGVFGFCALLATFAAGATALAMPIFDAAVAARTIAERKVTHLFGTDPMLAAILDTTDDPQSLRSLRRGGFADFGGTLARQLERWEHEVGVRFTGLYGSSECFALMASWPPDLPLPERARVGGVLVDPTIDVRAADPDTGEIRPPGVAGELQFRGYNVTPGYIGNTEATARALTADGWFRSGDLGTALDAHSFVFAARLGDSLRLRGYLVDPREIEEFLEQHASVAKAQVVGVDGPSGQVPVAFVQPRSGAAIDAEELIAFAAARIASYKVPRTVIAVDSFPTTPSPNGEKIRKAELRDRARQVVER